MSKLEAWLESIDCEGELVPVAADASFRKYYRFKSSLVSLVVMDSSLQKDSLLPFIDIANRLSKAGVKSPKIFNTNLEDGFLLMEDLGNTHLFNKLSGDFEPYYIEAINNIVKMQNTNTTSLPTYDEEFLKFEMNLMQEWYLVKHLGINLDHKEQQKLSNMLEYIVTQVMSQPQSVFVHRDYHSRNIMLSESTNEVVVIDYQDARVGAITYDLVSLLRDVYVELNPSFVEKMVLTFRDSKNINVDDDTFMRWFDFMGLQRHIKILGIFARLNIRDGKEEYLKSIPLTLKYIKDVSSKYEETKGLVSILLTSTVEPPTH